MATQEEVTAGWFKRECFNSHLAFVKRFFKERNGMMLIVNWHHTWISDELEGVINGDTRNLLINLPPGGSKTEFTVINFIPWGLAKNPRARFLHLSYSDSLALLNSETSRDLVKSEEYQDFWPLLIASDTKSKKRWNVTVGGKKQGGVYATSLNGQVTGFRAGHMAPGWQGAIILDDLMKPEDAFSKQKLDQGNRRLLTTVKSRRASPKTPIVAIMQRIAPNDPSGFILSGGLPGHNFKHIKIPALIDDDFVMKNVPEKYWGQVNSTVRDSKGRFSYWEEKEPLEELLALESGEATDKDGNLISKHVFNAQWQQEPTSLGGNVFKGKEFVRYTVLPKILYRQIFADTAQKTQEHNDYSVFQCWGMGDDGKIYLLDQIRGKWESPALRNRARAFWQKHATMEWEKARLGTLRRMIVEDKSSGTDVIQTLRLKKPQIPIIGIERNKDKYLRSQDALPYIELGMVCVPESSGFTSDFIGEVETFKADLSHAHDDQVDPMMDAVENMLSSKNNLKVWENLANDDD